jgi:hypothetical protein
VVELIVGRSVMMTMMVEGHGREIKKREDCAETRKAGFLPDFGTNFLFSHAMKSTSIYRRWKRAILSTLEKNCSP